MVSDQNVVDKLNGMIRLLFETTVRRDEALKPIKAREAALQAEKQKVLQQFDPAIEDMKAAIKQLIVDNRSELLASGKQSFATVAAIFQFRKASGQMKITDRSGIMKVARRFGVVRKIARLSMERKLDAALFKQWLDKHPEMSTLFEDFVEVNGGETLSVKPNTGYTVYFNNQRISPPSTSLEPKN